MHILFEYEKKYIYILYTYTQMMLNFYFTSEMKSQGPRNSVSSEYNNKNNDRNNVTQ